MTTKFEVPVERLTWRCDLSFLPFTCTAEMTPLEDFIGQDRAIRAIEFGLGVNKPGFNIFVTGLTGTGKDQHYQSVSQKNHQPTGNSAGRCAVAGRLVLRLQFYRCRSAAGAQDPPRLGQDAQGGYGAIGAETCNAKPKKCSRATTLRTNASR